MKQVLVGIAISIFTLTVQADCRLNESADNRRMHGPYSVNTDIESRTGNFKANSFPPDANGNERFAYASTKLKFGCRDGWGPKELEHLKVGQSVIIDTGMTGETCAYTDTDGNAYNLPWWTVRTKKVKEVAVKHYDGYGPMAWCYYEQTLHAFGVSGDAS